MTFFESAPPGSGPNYEQAFALRPTVYASWQGLNGAIKADADLRRYELATIAAARRLKSSYCMLAHGSVLTDTFVSVDELRAIAADHRAAGLDAVDVAVMDLAEKVADDAASVTREDWDHLRAEGLSDAEIMDVVLAASARCFFSKVLDAVGAQADSSYRSTVDASLHDVLVVGRPIAD